MSTTKIEALRTLARHLDVTDEHVADCAGVTVERLREATDEHTDEVLAAVCIAQRYRDGIPTCRPTRPTLTMCPAMERYAGTGSGKGLKASQVVKMRTGENLYEFVAYKDSAKDRGVALNRCPWCGGGIAFAFVRDGLIGPPQTTTES